MSTTIVYERSFFADLNGKPLDNGSVYIGEANQDPQTDPIQCYWDAGLTVPATQPLAVSAGYVVNAGARAAVYVAEDSYSLRARNSAGVQVDYVADANDGSLRDALTAPGGSALVGYIQSGAGAEAWTVQAKARESASVTEFIAEADRDAILGGTTDGTAQVNAALAAVGASGGGSVKVPRGANVKITGTLSIGHDGVKLCGDSRFGSKLIFANGSSDCITHTADIYGLEIADIYLDHTAKTGGKTLAASQLNSSQIYNVFLNNPYIGLDLYRINDFKISHVHQEGCVGGTSGYAIKYYAPADGSGRSDVLTIEDYFAALKYSGADGLLWDGEAHTVNAMLCSFTGTRYGMRVRNTAASASRFPQFFVSTNFVVDGAMAKACYIEAGRDFRFVEPQLTNGNGNTGQGGTDDHALAILADAGASQTAVVRINGGRVGLSGQSAIWSGAKDVMIDGVLLPPGSTQVNNTYAAVDLQSTSEDVNVIDCDISEFGGGTTWKYGASVMGGVRINVDRNRFKYAQTSPVLWRNNDSESYCGTNTVATVEGEVTTPATVASSASLSLTAAQFMGGILQLTGGAAANWAATSPTAAQIIGQVQASYLKTFDLMLLNATAFQCTLQPGAGVSFSGITTGGNFVMAANTQKLLKVVVLNTLGGAEAVTVYG